MECHTDELGECSPVMFVVSGTSTNNAGPETPQGSTLQRLCPGLHSKWTGRSSSITFHNPTIENLQAETFHPAAVLERCIAVT